MVTSPSAERKSGHYISQSSRLAVLCTSELWRIQQIVAHKPFFFLKTKTRKKEDKAIIFVCKKKEDKAIIYVCKKKENKAIIFVCKKKEDKALTFCLFGLTCQFDFVEWRQQAVNL